MPEKNKSQDSTNFLSTDRGKTKSNAIEVPGISLPKGGGAIKGIDEKFSVNAVNGTSAFSIPLPVSPARALTPSLSLSYNSGSGNGIFGLGWSLGLPSIIRKTDRLLPRYLDTEESDTYLFSEAEDLVPLFAKDDDGRFLKDANGEYIVKESTTPDDTFVIRYYQPRIEGLFARIERWIAKAGGEVKWRVITRDNVTTLFGWSAQSRIENPFDNSQVFEWLPEFVFDDKGNCTRYIYKKEDGTGLDLSKPYNRHRNSNGDITYTNCYLTNVLYGNKTAYKQFGQQYPADNDFLFETIFDFGSQLPGDSPDKLRAWDLREDAFSNYRSGFEIRTTRLCKRVLLFHHFDGADEYDGLVSSVNIEYDTTSASGFTFLRAFYSVGYDKNPDGSYSSKSLPPMEFDYQRHEWSKDVKSVSVSSLVHSPSGLAQSSYQFVDLFSEGLSGILTEQSNAWYYKSNSGNAEFEETEISIEKPSFSGLGQVLQFTDLDSDGGKQLVSFETEPRGYFERDDSGDWINFQPFQQLPSINFQDPNVRMIDLNGDGKPELVISEDQVFTWYPSEGKRGFSEAQKVITGFDEDKGPAIIFSDIRQSVFLADMSGDGLTDIVRIRNGEVCFWPNMGYGKFGAKVIMENAPVFDFQDAFNPAFIQLSDIDGSGTTDIIYLGKNKFCCWLNLSGNSFQSTPFQIDAFPEIHNQSQVTVTDLLGNGLSCIVWSSLLDKDSQSSMRYVDLMNSKKPHLLTAYRNNMGKEVSLEYKPSTYYYLEDKRSGHPWITKLHFPVHCISKSTTSDLISGYRFSSEYSYHHGYYDHVEKEFRGFGRVEQIDVESYEHWVKQTATNITERPLYQEPILVKTWYHTGAFLQQEAILEQYADEYWFNEMNRKGFPGSVSEVQLPDARIVSAEGADLRFPDLLTVDELQEAYRACKGMALRKETFAIDSARNGSTPDAIRKELTPYTVSTHSCLIEFIQPKGRNRFAVYAVKESESVNYQYDRNAEDPRIAHSLNLDIDEYGNILESVSIVYPRKSPDITLPDSTQDDQQKTVVIFQESKYTNDINTADKYRLRLLSESNTYEIRGLSSNNTLFKINDFTGLISDLVSDSVLYYEIDKPLVPGRRQRRLIESVRTLYYKDDLSGALPLHQIESEALPYESYQLAFTPQLITAVYGGRVDNLTMAEGRYTPFEGDANWWVRSGTTQFISAGEIPADALNRFYSPVSYTDPYGAVTRVTYYGAYFLVISKTEDALGNQASVEKFNFRTLSPRRMKDSNGNLSESIADELGFVKAMAVMGKGAEADELTGLSEITDAAETTAISDFFQSAQSSDLVDRAKQLLGRASVRFVYDFEAFSREGKPAVVSSITREQHFQHSPDSPVQLSFEYTNGLGEVVMKKVQAEPGIARKVEIQPDSSVVVSDINTANLNPVQLRWIGNGRVVKNNKGNAVKQYEPYFSLNWQFEDLPELVETGVTPVLYYDAIGRLVKTELPDGTFTKTEFSAWKQVVHDACDTVTDSEWFIQRSQRLMDAALLNAGKNPGREKDAADQSGRHAATPSVLHFDSMGRPVLSIEHNKDLATNADEFYETRVHLDTEGNLRSVWDARANRVMRYEYDMLGNVVQQHSMDAGQRWTLQNILGKPIRTWDERNHEFRYFYDILQRPVRSKVTGGDGPVPLDHIFERLVYGEDLLTAGRGNEAALQARNVLGQVVQHFDTAGLVESPDFDFKGLPVFTTRKLLKDYKGIVDWSDGNLATALEAGAGYTFRTETDALGRIVKQVTPEGSTITPSYNEGGLFNGESVLHPGDANDTVYIKDIDYNEKGQRSRVIYGNNVTSTYSFDRDTFRMIRLETRRGNGDPLQDWNYTYDAAGNITAIEDRNIPVQFFDNQKVSGISTYQYDALYRLREATGRENDAALAFGACDNWNDKPFLRSLAPGDSMVVRNYTQRYRYDAVGNVLEMKHVAAGGQWTRGYEYEANSNRLVRTFIGDTAVSANYTQYAHHEKHGFLESLPHLEKIGWNFKEEVIVTTRQHCTDDAIPVTTYYQYDAAGQRVRKVTENQAVGGAAPTRKEERIYVSGFEMYRKFSGPHAGLERTTLSLLDEGHRFVMIETRNNVDDGSATKLVRYQLGNHLGSSALELDENAAVISYEEYHPFGTTAYQAVNKNLKSASKRYRFTGMERDEETGLEYHSARYYLPWLGRWLSSDPIGIGDGVNVYAYVNNKPTLLGDFSGKDGETCSIWDEESLTCYEEECPIESLPEDEPPTSDTPENVIVRRRVEPSHDSVRRIEPPAPSIHPDNMRLGSSGVRLRADVPRAHYDNFVARDMASYGYYRLAEVAEAGHGCAFCHIVKSYDTMAEANSAIDLAHYNSVANWMAFGRDQGVLLVATMGMSAATAPLRGAAAIGETTLAGAETSEMVTIYRGTSHALELEVLGESGIVMSDAARIAYVEARMAGTSAEVALASARTASEAAHVSQVGTWGSLSEYVQAHGAFGTEISVFGPRSLISFTTDSAVAARFAGTTGTVISTTVPRSILIPQTLAGATESEVLIMNMLRINP